MGPKFGCYGFELDGLPMSELLVAVVASAAAEVELNSAMLFVIGMTLGVL